MYLGLLIPEISACKQIDRQTHFHKVRKSFFDHFKLWEGYVHDTYKSCLFVFIEFQINHLKMCSSYSQNSPRSFIVCDGRRQLDKRLKTIKQRPKVHLEPAENGVGRRVLLPVRAAGPMSCPTIVAVDVAVVFMAVGYGKQTMQAFKHLCNIN